MPRPTRPMDAVVYVMIHTSFLKTPPSYQRRLEKSRSKRIADKFSWDAFGTLLVKQVGGIYYVYDGQHRLNAANQAFPEGVYVPCQITKLTAHLAIILKNTNVKPFSKNDIFWANVDGKELHESTVVQIFEKEFGITLSRGQNKGKYVANECKCVATLSDILDDLGNEDTRFLCAMLTRYFSRPDSEGVEEIALSSVFLKGLARFIQTAEESEVTRKLRRNDLSAAAIVKLAKKDYSVSDGNRHQSIWKIFNKM